MNKIKDSENPNIQNLLSRREASAFLHIGMRTLDDWKKKKKVSFYKFGGRILYDKNDLLALLEKENKE